jgi:hypothetical protein
MGGHQAPIKTPSQIEFPTLSFYVPESDAQPFLDHFNRRAMITEREQRTDSANKTGTIETYDSEMKPLFTLEFFEADICNVTIEKSDATSEEVKQVKIDLFIERMTFTYAATDLV